MYLLKRYCITHQIFFLCALFLTASGIFFATYTPTAWALSMSDYMKPSDDCSGYAGAYTPVNQFGSAVNIFSSSRETIIRGVCPSRNQFGSFVGLYISPPPGGEQNSFATYKSGYLWNGTQWVPFQFNLLDDAQVSGSYLFGPVGLYLFNDMFTKPVYMVAFSCIKRTEGWKCGCRDSACTTSHWQLQAAVPSKKFPELEGYGYTSEFGKIMPIGDSITQGNSGSYTYRYFLWKKLRETGRVDFVGSLKNNYNGNPSFPDQNFDKDHEGHWGWRADEILANISGWFDAAQPDTVLLHIGTNDILQGQSVASTFQEIKNIIQLILDKNNHTTVIVARIIPVANNSDAEEKIIDLNNNIQNLGAFFPNGRLKIVDMWEGFDARSDTYDGVHPNENGERKMADKWKQFIQPVAH